MEKFFRAKKTLGQNFLKSESVLNKIISAGRLSQSDTILEVGPGTGNLTVKLIKNSKKVIAVEKDDRLIEFLKEKFQEEIKEGKFEIIHEDILEFDPKHIENKNYKIIANIPYYITGKLLRKFLESDHKPSLMVLMLQREVAKRIVARDNKESVLSLSVKAFGNPKYITTVKKELFKPKPKVDSAIILIDEIKEKISEGLKENFFEILKAGFKSKRKKLSSNLKSIYNLEKIKEAFEKLGISENARAEDLPLDKWLSLFKELKS